MYRILSSWLLWSVPMMALLVGAAIVLDGGTARLSLADMICLQAFLVALVALVCEYVDSTLGMGYGTALTPLLLIVGYEAKDVVPAVLLSELATGAMAALLHHKAGNVTFRRDSRDTRVALVLGVCSTVGALGAVLVAISIPKFWLNLYIAALVLAMGVLILAWRSAEHPFSWKRIVGLGVLASFNKGMSGGGYGPVVTCGQILSGVGGKRAIAVTSLAEALTCFVGLVGFVAVKGWPNWTLAVPMTIGALCSTPLAAWSVSKMGTRRLTTVIGLATLALGGLSLWKAVH